MSDTAKLEAATLEAKVARARLLNTAHAIQERIKPDTLLDEAVDSVRIGASGLVQTGADVARRKPGVAAAAVGAGALLLLRRPIGRLFGRRARETD